MDSCTVSLYSSLLAASLGASFKACTTLEGSAEQGEVEKTGCKIICGAPTTLAVKGLMMMMMANVLDCKFSC